MTCKHNINNSCKISEELAGIPVPIDDNACQICQQQLYPMTINKVTRSRAAYTLHKLKLTIPSGLLNKEDHIHKQHTTGTKLKQLISWFPVPNKNGCRSCRALEAKMNRWGPDGCESKKAYIIGKLRIAALRRGLPFSERLVTILVDKAIKASR